MTKTEVKKLVSATGMSRRELAQALDVTPASVGRWINGKAKPTKARVKAMEKLANQAEAPKSPPSATPTQPEPSFATYGAWVQVVREKEGKSISDLAAASGVSGAGISRIESGHSKNPRPETRKKIEKALGKKPPKSIADQIIEDTVIQDVGELSDFNPHDPTDYPVLPGVYVFYDVSDRPLYIGESNNIARRVKQHQEKFWFRPQLVTTASFVEVKNGDMRSKLEQTLIKFLKSNAVLNKAHVES